MNQKENELIIEITKKFSEKIIKMFNNQEIAIQTVTFLKEYCENENLIEKKIIELLLERIDIHGKENQNQNIFLIIDKTDKKDKNRRILIENYINSGTNVQNLTNVKEEMFFIDSKTSKLMQFADTVSYCFQRSFKIFLDQEKNQLSSWDKGCLHIIRILLPLFRRNFSNEIHGVGLKLNESKPNQQAFEFICFLKEYT